MTNRWEAINNQKPGSFLRTRVKMSRTETKFGQNDSIQQQFVKPKNKSIIIKHNKSHRVLQCVVCIGSYRSFISADSKTVLWGEKRWLQEFCPVDLSRIVGALGIPRSCVQVLYEILYHTRKNKNKFIWLTVQYGSVYLCNPGRNSENNVLQT